MTKKKTSSNDRKKTQAYNSKFDKSAVSLQNSQTRFSRYSVNSKVSKGRFSKSKSSGKSVEASRSKSKSKSHSREKIASKHPNQSMIESTQLPHNISFEMNQILGDLRNSAKLPEKKKKGKSQAQMKARPKSSMQGETHS